MKKILVFLFLSVLSLYSQPYQINYSVIIENCQGTSNYEIMSGSMVEGESFTFQAVNFPAEYSSAQFLYNIFVGGEFGIPTGSLTENIDIKINMGKFWCDLNILEEPKGVFRLFSLFIEVIGATSGSHSNSYYWFKDDKEAFIKLKLSNISFYLNLLKINDPNKIDVFFVGSSTIDQSAVRKEVTGTHYIIYPKHFSLLSAGVINAATDVKPDEKFIINQFTLDQNYPNPFNPSTLIRFSLPESGFTSLVVYNVIGEIVQTLFNGYKNSGSYEVNFDAKDLPSGLYFYSLTSGNFKQTKKMIITK